MIKTLQSDFLFSKGQRQASQGNTAESIKTFDRALSIKPKCSGIYLHKAFSLEKLQEYDEAIKELKKAIYLKPHNPAYHLFLGRLYYDYKRHDDALHAFNRSLELAPHNTLCLCYKYLVLLVKGIEINEACIVLRENISNTNTEFQGRLLVECESLLYKNRDITTSLDKNLFGTRNAREYNENSFTCKLQRLLVNIRYFYNSDKKNAYCHLLSGNNKFLSGDIDGSTTEYKSALKFSPDLDEIKDRLQEAYLYKEDYNKLLKYIKSFPEYKEVMNLLSKNEHKDQNSEIIRIKHQDLIFKIGYIYYQTREYDKAADMFEMIVESDPNDYEPFYYLGLSFIAKGDHDKAYTWFHKAIEKTNQSLIKNRSTLFFILTAVNSTCDIKQS